MISDEEKICISTNTNSSLVLTENFLILLKCSYLANIINTTRYHGPGPQPFRFNFEVACWLGGGSRQTDSCGCFIILIIGT